LLVIKISWGGFAIPFCLHSHEGGKRGPACEPFFPTPLLPLRNWKKAVVAMLWCISRRTYWKGRGERAWERHSRPLTWIDRREGGITSGRMRIQAILRLPPAGEKVGYTNHNSNKSKARGYRETRGVATRASSFCPPPYEGGEGGRGSLCNLCLSYPRTEEEGTTLFPETLLPPEEKGEFLMDYFFLNS